ncbi:MAG TPA: twin-arginine translocase TatA/TatE family subunit [Verrucomicrobiae bacterium]|nr:twin-arginine translocase TatA/TatE family subunit [Verrucomicrobiae bacterium]
MNTLFAAFLGGWEWVIVLLAVLLLFGAKKIPELARGLGQGIKEFKKATKEVTDEIQNAPVETTPAKPTITAQSQPASTVPQNSNPPTA